MLGPIFTFAIRLRLVSDKIELGFRYPCDGPGRGGTCQISPWDHIFLAVFGPTTQHQSYSFTIFGRTNQMCGVYGPIIKYSTLQTVTLVYTRSALMDG